MNRVLRYSLQQVKRVEFEAKKKAMEDARQSKRAPPKYVHPLVSCPSIRVTVKLAQGGAMPLLGSAAAGAGQPKAGWLAASQGPGAKAWWPGGPVARWSGVRVMPSSTSTRATDGVLWLLRLLCRHQCRKLASIGLDLSGSVFLQELAKREEPNRDGRMTVRSTLCR